MIYSYMYTDNLGLVEEENYFISAALELFNTATILNLPVWASSAGNN